MFLISSQSSRPYNHWRKVQPRHSIQYRGFLRKQHRLLYSQAPNRWLKALTSFKAKSFSGIFGHSLSLLEDGSLVICGGYRGDLLGDATGVANCISWKKDGADDSWQIFATLR